MAVPTPYIHLPLHIGTRDETDSSNVHTKDVIRRKDAVLGDGSTASTFPDQKYDKGLQFDGANQYVKIDDPLTSASESAFTVSMLVNGDITGTPYLYSGNDGSNVHSVVIYQNSSSKWQFYAGGGLPGNAANFLDTNAGELRHIVGVYDGTDTKIYVGGISGTDATSALAPDYNNQDLYLGRDYDASNDYSGQILDLKVWNDVALTQAEVQALYAEDIAEYQAYLSYPEPTTDIQFEPDQYKASNTDGIEQVDDHDMSGEDTSGWTALRSATLSKVSDGDGGQALRVTETSSNYAAATQTITVKNSARYRVIVEIRTNGLRDAYVRTDSGSDDKLVLPAASTGWHRFEYEHDEVSLAIEFGLDGTTIGSHYMECRLVSIQYTEGLWEDLSGNGNHLIRGVGSGSAYSALGPPQPGKGLTHTPSHIADAILDPFSAGVSNFEMSILVRMPDAITGTTHIATFGGTNVIYMLLALTTPAISFYCGSGSGVNAAYWAGGNKAGELVHIRGVHKTGVATEIYIDNVLSATASTPATPVLDTPTPQFARFGSNSTAADWKIGRTAHFYGTYYSYRYWPFNLTDEEREAEYFDTMERFSRYHI